MEFVFTTFLTSFVSFIRSVYFVPAKDEDMPTKGKHKNTGKKCQTFNFQTPSWYRKVTVKKTGDSSYRVTFNKILSPIFQVNRIGKEYATRQTFGTRLFIRHLDVITSVVNQIFDLYPVKISFADIHVVNGDFILNVTTRDEFDEDSLKTSGTDMLGNYDLLFRSIMSSKYQSHSIFKYADLGLDDSAVCSMILSIIDQLLTDYVVVKDVEKHVNTTTGFVIPTFVSGCYREDCFADGCIRKEFVMFYHVANPIASIVPKIIAGMKHISCSHVDLDVLKEDVDPLEREYIFRKIRTWLTLHNIDHAKVCGIVNGATLTTINCPKVYFINDYIRRCKGCIELYTVDSFNRRSAKVKTQYTGIRNACCRKNWCIGCLQHHMQSSLERIVNGDGSLSFPFTIKCPCMKSVEFARLFQNYLILPAFLTDGDFKSKVISMIRFIKEAADARPDDVEHRMTPEEADTMLDEIVRPSLEAGHHANKCPTCYKIIIKHEGCNAVVCPMSKCKTSFCIICGVIITARTSQRCGCRYNGITGHWVEDNGHRIEEAELDQMPALLPDRLALWRV